ncbi:MAG: P1 family peptidase [Parachlamydia sp.]|nr:P1 family peptidase [Parachlamydia sp.]
MSTHSIDAVPVAAHISEGTKKILKRTSEVDRVVETATVHLYPGEKRVRIENMQGDSEALFQDVIDYSLENKCRSIAMKVFNKEFDYEILKELPRAELKKALKKGLITKEEYISTLRARAVPKNSTSQHPLQVDMEGVSFACCEYSEGPVGITLVKFDEAAKCHKDVRGGNPGLLDSQSNLGKGMVEGICVTGGSNPDLAAAASISDAVEIQFGEEHTCFEGVAIFSHNLVEKDDSQYYIADQRLGHFATAHLSKLLYSGQVGGGCSAAKGQGVAFGTVNGYKVAAIVVNNSWGDLYPDGIPPNQNLPKSIELVHPKQNTTITIVVTDLDLDQHELAQLSHQIHGPIMGRYIHPFHTLLDGDVFYACSTAKKKNKKLTQDVTKLTEFYKGVGEIVIHALKNSNHSKKH